MQCGKCTHKEVCKHKPQFDFYMDKIKEIDIDFGLPFKIDMQCSKFDMDVRQKSSYLCDNPFVHSTSWANY